MAYNWNCHFPSVFGVGAENRKAIVLTVLDVERRFHYAVYTNTTEPTGRLLAVAIDIVFVRRAGRLTYKMVYMYALALKIDSIGVSIAYRRILIGGTCYENLFSYWKNDGEKRKVTGQVNRYSFSRRRRFKLSKCIAL